LAATLRAAATVLEQEIGITYKVDVTFRF